MFHVVIVLRLCNFDGLLGRDLVIGVTGMVCRLRETETQKMC